MKNKIVNIMLVILVVSLLIVIALIVHKYYSSYENEKALMVVANDFRAEIEKSNKENKIIENNVGKNEKNIDIKYKGFDVLGIINIPKIEIDYPVLSETTDESMKISITKFWGNNINEVGNFTMAGHNFFDNTLFGRINELEISDEIYMTDINGEEIKYIIFDKYVIDPNDVSCVKSVEEGTKEITLITCIDGRSKRLIIKAREFLENKED